MWISEIIEQKLQRQAAGPVRYRHLQVFEDGKIAEGGYAQQISLWQRVCDSLARRQRSLRLCDKPPQ